MFYIIFLLLIISLTKGATEIFGISETITQLVIDGLVLLLFSLSFLRMLKHKSIKGPAFFLNILLIIVILISFFISLVNEIQMILFVRKFGIYYLFFYALYNSNLSEEEKDKLFKLLVFLFLAQIPAAFIKLGLIGTMEDYVGMMTIQQGSLATIMPIMAISFLIAGYLEYQKIKILFFIVLFIAIGLISNKMGILFYVIFLFIILSYLYSLRYTQGMNFINILFFRKMLLVSMILTFIFLAFISLNPRANPEGIVGGSIDIEHLTNYIDDYQNLKLKDSRTEGDGRFEAPVVAFDRLKSAGISNILFGFGPGDIVKSSYTPFDDPLLQKYNIGYGGRLGLVYIMIQLGFVGVTLFILFHIILFKKLWILYTRIDLTTYGRTLVLGALGFPLIFMLDFFTYSSILIIESGMALSYYFVIYYILTSKNIEYKQANQKKI